MTEVWVPEPEDFKGPWYRDPRWRTGILLAILAGVIVWEFVHD